MSSNTSKTLVVFGSGPGIGISVASSFALHGFNHIVLLSRNGERLQSDKGTILEQIGDTSVQIDTIQVDISNLNALKKALKEIDELGGNIECVFFNAARVAPSPLLEFPVEELELDFKTTNLAFYVVAQWAIPKLQSLAASFSTAKPSLLVTNSLLYVQPIPAIFSLSLVKAAQRSMVQSMNMEYGPQGIHVALVSVGGYVSPQMKVLNPANIAEKTWELFDQNKEEWKLEVELVEP